MLTFPCRIDPRVRILFTFPFRLDMNMLPWPMGKRQETLPGAAAELNSRWPKFHWEAVPFIEDESVPSLIRKKKGLYLMGTSTEATSLVSYVQEIPAVPTSLKITDVHESIWYYDWGTGAVDLTLDLLAANAASLTALLEFSEQIHDVLHRDRRLALFHDWERASLALTQCLTSSDLAERRRGGQTRLASPGKTDAYGINLILHSSPKGGIELSQVQLEAVLAGFAGRPASENDFVYLPGLLAVGEGYNGQFALLESGHCSCAQVRERVCWLWRLIALYWANLSLFSSGLADRTLDCLSADDRRIRRNLAAVQREHLALKLFLYEASPTNLCDDGLDLRVYEGIWKAWQSERLAEEVNEQLALLQTRFAGAVELMAAESQNKVNWILFVLNILTFSTVIATVIATYDVTNNVMAPDFRLLLIGGGTALFALVSLAFLAKNHLARLWKRKGRVSLP